MKSSIILPGLATLRLWMAALLALWLAGAVFVPGAAAQTDDSPHLTVVVEALNVREGPGMGYPSAGSLARGDQVPMIGRHAATGWWQVQLPGNHIGWVTGVTSYVHISGDTAGLPEVAAPPLTAMSGSTPAPIANPTLTGTIVFQTVSGGPIYAINADGTNLRYLTIGVDPALSPDGLWVAFTRWDNEQHGTLGSLWKIRIDGSDEQLVLDQIHQPKSPTWSPDGTQIALNVQNGGRTEYEYMCSSEMPTDPLYNPDEDNKRGIDIKIERDEDGDMSIRFCYTLLPHPHWGIQVVDADTGEGDIVSTNVFAYSPTWDPANPWRIVYRDDEKGLAVVDRDRKVGWALTPNLEYAPTNDLGSHAPLFSPDGSQLAVTYWQHDHWEVHRLNADGTGQVRLTETPWRAIGEQRLNGEEPRLWNNVAPAWSPDGSQIAFLTDRTGHWEIWVMHADGSHQRPLFAAGTLDGLALQYHGVDERVLSWR
jgi:hypothetical protein